MLNSFYDPLKKSVSILVIDDDPCLLNFYEEIISGHPMYKLTKASTARQAEQIIKSIAPIHFCTLDCAIRDIDNDEFYLLK